VVRHDPVAGNAEV